MKITFIAPGSRGDVQPYVALGKGLKAAGHTVGILAQQDFENLVTGHDLEFIELGGSAEEAARNMQDLVERGDFLKILSSMGGKSAQQMALQATEKGLAACREANLIAAGLGGLFIGLALSEKLDIPFVQAHLLPFTPTSEFSSLLMPLPRTPFTSWANGLSHYLGQQVFWQTFRSADNQARARVLQMPSAPLWGPFASLQQRSRVNLYGYSPEVLPPPGDWQGRGHVTGYWLLDPPALWEAPAELVRFLESGPPPVYIGFGSMPSSKPAQTADLVLQALTRTGQRGILSSGWGGLTRADLPETAFMVGSVPHSWLFPKMAAVVHHGGAGTTAAGLWAGVPAVVVPVFGDQPFWGQRVFDLGVGPAPIPRRNLTVDGLAEALRRATEDAKMREDSAALGERIRSEDGVGRAVALIEAHHG